MIRLQFVTEIFVARDVLIVSLLLGHFFFDLPGLGEGHADRLMGFARRGHSPRDRPTLTRIREIDAGMPESQWVSQQLGRQIFKAFNGVMCYALSELGLPFGTPGRLALPVAGDDAGGKLIVMGLVNEMGFDPVDGGSLAESWRQQPSTPAYCCDYGAARTLEGLRAAVKGKAERIRDTEWREKYPRLFANHRANADVHADIIALNRSLNPF